MNDALRAAIQINADYGDHPEGRLSEGELAELNQQVVGCLSTTNGDAGECVVSARQLALLLAAAARVNSLILVEIAS